MLITHNLLSSYFFLIYTCVNLFEIEIHVHNKLLLFHWRVTYLTTHVIDYDYELYFSDKIGGTVRVAHEKCKYSVSNY